MLSRLARLAAQNLTFALTGRAAADEQLEQQRATAALLAYAVLLFALYRLPFYTGSFNNPCTSSSTFLEYDCLLNNLILA